MSHPQTADDKFCARCFYSWRCGDRTCCEFILVTGKRRGCDPGRGCKRFLEGDSKLRCFLDPEKELPPGILPEKITAASPNAGKRRRVPVDMTAYRRLRMYASATTLAQLTGTSTAYWSFMIQRDQLVNPGVADVILKHYGVDLRKR